MAEAGGLTFDQVMGGQTPGAATAVAPAMTYDEVMKLSPSGVEAGQRTGYLANIWAGIHEGVAALSGISEASPWRTALEAFGIEAPSVSRGLLQSKPVTDVAPGSVGEGAARAATRGAVTMLGPAGVGKAVPEAAALTMGSPVRAGVVGATGGVTGAAFADVVPEEWKDVAETAGQYLGSFGALGGEAALRGMGRRVVGAAQANTGGFGGPAAEVVNPETGQPFTTAATTGVPGAPEPVVATPHEMALAGKRIASASGQTPAELQARIPTGPWGETPPTVVPGSQPSLGQTTGDVGVLGLERTLRSLPHGREAATVSEARNNLARVQALENATPSDVGAAAGDYLRAQLQAAQHEHETATTAGHAWVGATAEAAGMHEPGAGVPGVEEMGAEQRAALEARRLPEKAAAGRALDAIDPDKKLAIDGTSVGDEARRIRKEEVGEGGSLEGLEHGPLDAAAGYRGVIPFSQLRSLMSTVSETMRRIRGTPGMGAESVPYRRMAMLMSSITKAMGDAAERAGNADVTTGTAPGARTVDRLVENFGEQGAGAAGVRGAVPEPIPPGPAVGGAGANGTQYPGEGAAVGRGSSAGAGGVEGAPSTANRPRRPETLLDWIIQQGGIKGDADLAAMDADKYHHRQGGRLVNAAGRSADYVREGAVEQGFLKQGADINDLRKAIGDSLAGNEVVRPEQAADMAAWRQWNAETGALEARRSAAEARVLDVEHEMGARLSQDQIGHAVDMLVRDPNMHPEAALREAMRAGEEGTLKSYSARDAMGPPGVSPRAQQAELQVPSPLVENLTAAKAAEMRAANRRYADYKATYRSGAVGEALASGERGFRAGDAEVPGKLFRAGPKGAAAADSLVKAAGGTAEAQAMLGDYPALVLRNMAMRDGTLSDAGYQRFMRQYGPALSKFPELAARFRTVAEAQRQADAASARGVERVREFQDSAAKYYLGKGDAGADPIKAIGNLLGSENAPAAARDLMTRVGNNQAARDGVQNNAIRWVLSRAEGTGEAGTSGERELRNAPIQRILNSPQMAPALRAILTPEQFRTLVSVGRDLDVANRAVNAVKIPGSPGSAADLHAVMHEGGHNPSQLLQIWLGEKAGEMVGHLLGVGPFVTMGLEAATMIGAGWMKGAKAAGYGRVLDLATEGVHNPALGRVLLQAATNDAKAPIFRQTMHRLFTAATGIGAQSQAPRER